MCAFQNDLFQVVVFGTGFGECTLVHIGNNEWIVVDSCLDPITKTPCALNYLAELSVKPAESIRLVVATHWDSDHIEGLKEIISASPKSEFVMSKALQKNEFLLFIFALPEIEGLPQKATKEFSEIFEFYRERKQSGRVMGPITFASENQHLIRDEIEINGVLVQREIIALSPSTVAQVKGLEGLASLMSNELLPVRNLRKLNNNHTSIVLWVKVGDINVLLGADLEELGVQDDGWQRIVNNGKFPPNHKCEIFKIPHHGSKNAHHEGIWPKLIGNRNLSVVTSFKRGSIDLPSENDLRRLTEFSGNTYLAGSSSKGRDKTLNNVLRKVDKTLQRKKRQLGWVIMQKKINSSSNWTTDCKGSSIKI